MSGIVSDRSLEVRALCDGAVLLTRHGNRIAALALLWSAVGIAPTDLNAHRRLAAALANSGDLDAAAEEYARFVEFMLKAGDYQRAALEFAYARNAVGQHAALDKVGGEMVPLSAAVHAIELPPALLERNPAIVTTGTVEPIPHEHGNTVTELLSRALAHAEPAVASPRFRLPRRFARVAVIALAGVLGSISASNLSALAPQIVR